MYKTILILCCVFILSSCVVKTHYLQEGAQTFENVSVEEVQVYSSEDINLDYIVIGSIAVDAPGGSKAALKALKQEAALIGANAIIDVKLTKLSSFASRTGLSGVAVRLQ